MTNQRIEEIVEEFREKFVSKDDTVQICADGEAALWADIEIPFGENEYQSTPARPIDVEDWLREKLTSLIEKAVLEERRRFVNIMRGLATIYIHRSSKTGEENTVIGVSMTDVLQALSPQDSNHE